METTRRRVTLDNSGLRYRARPLRTEYPVASHRLASQGRHGVIQDGTRYVHNPNVAARAGRISLRPAFVPPDQEVLSVEVEQPPQSQSGQMVVIPVDQLGSIVRTINAEHYSTSDAMNDAPLSRPYQQPEFRRSNWFMRAFCNVRSVILVAMSIVLFVGGGYSLFVSLRNNHAVTQQVQAMSESVPSEEGGEDRVTNGSARLSEEPVSLGAVRAYTVAPEQPRYISIPKIKVNGARVLRMGLTNEGAIDTPKNIWDTGWYEDSSLPGDKIGAPLIVGHVSGPETGGVFYNLYRLTDGDEIIIETGDGTHHSYRVVAKEEVPKDQINMNTYLVSKDIDKPGLTLMTCSGEFNPVTQQYENRLAVFALRQD